MVICLDIRSTLCKRFSKLNKILKKDKAGTENTSFFVIVHFVFFILFDFWHGSFVWKWYVFNLIIFNKELRCPNFVEVVFVSQKTCVKVKYWKHLKSVVIVIKKHSWKYLVLFSRRAYLFSVDFKTKSLTKIFFLF